MSQFPSTSLQAQRDSPSAYKYSRADWDGVRDHLKDVLWEDIFKLIDFAAAAAAEFCDWCQIGNYAYVTHRK